LVLINPAQDFTERLMWPGLADHERQAILRDGETIITEEGLGSYALTRRMFEEARDWLLLDGVISITAPIHILQGGADDVVPWRHQMELVERLRGGDVRLDRIEGGDHRLSSEADLLRLTDAVARFR
jgi:pimeloyl-ACP methyl ester carboxylesterase